jgi:uncharacterized protein involved in exopolysaccharide biosynthesis
MRNSEGTPGLPGLGLSDELPLQTFVVREDQVSVRDLLLFLWRNRWIALATAGVCAIGAALVSFMVTPKYTATMTIIPVSNETGTGLSSLGSAASSLSGLASLAGVHLGGEGKAEMEALATLQSQILTDTYVQQHNLLPILFSSQWDAASGKWKTRDPKKIPTLWKANQLFKGTIRTVEENTRTGLVTLSIKWKNPQLAAQWANGLVQLTNDYLRQKAIDESERSIAYLNQEIARTNIVEVKNAIYTLMEEEIKKEMIAKGRDEFALRVIDPAFPPERKSFPQRFLWILGGALGGLFFGFLGCVVRETVIDERSSAAPERRPSHGTPRRLTETVLESTNERP